MGVRFGVSSAVGGGICVIDVVGDAEGLGGVLARCGVSRLPGVGAVGVRGVGGVDEALLVRVSGGHVQVHAHGGAYVVGRVCGVLSEAGAEADAGVAWREVGGDVFERCLLEALSRCASGAGVGLLLRQRALWANAVGFDVCGDAARERARLLGRLVEPAVVAVVGRANVGKSTLTNAVARRGVSIVSAEPGTTRDHVGVLVGLGGVVVRWVDTPGVLGEGVGGALDREALRVSRSVIREAALVVHCAADAGGLLTEGELRAVGVVDGVGVVRCRTKGDLGGAGAGGSFWDVVTAAGAGGGGVAELGRAVAEGVVPVAERERAEPWVFDERLVGDVG